MRATLYSDQNLIELVDAWEPVVTSIQLHPGVVNKATQIRPGGPDLGLQHGHLDGLHEHR